MLAILGLHASATLLMTDSTSCGRAAVCFAGDETPSAASAAVASAGRRLVLAGAAALVTSSMGGCAFGRKPASAAATGAAAAAAAAVAAPAPAAQVLAPTVLAGSISAAANLNPSVSQRPSPLLVRLYELRTSTAFGKADFTSLHQSDVATLGTELVVRDEFMLMPGESRTYQRTLAPDTRFIGVFGVYRDIERAVWRASAAVQPGRKQNVVIRADGLVLSVVIQP